MSSRASMTRMWLEACRMLEEAEGLKRQFFQPGPAWEAPLDLFETEREFWVVAALPGVAPEHLNVTLEGQELRIEGQRSLPALGSRARIHRLEIPCGRFERRVKLPAMPLELRRRELAGGLLTLVFLKRS